jgi:hypothetical protein
LYDQANIQPKEASMFKSITPVLLMACALARTLWPTFAGDSTYATFGWALAGMVMLYTVSMLIERRNGSAQAVANVLEEAARVNAARVAPPPVTSCRRVEATGR